MQVKTFSTTAIKRNNDHAILAVFMWATGCILPITFCKIYVQSQNHNSHFQVTLLFPACAINKMLVFWEFLTKLHGLSIMDGLKVGLDDFKGPFQLNDSTIL